MSDDIKKGLLGIVVDETEVSKVMPEINSLTYRGYAAQDLCAKCKFEEVAYLLLHDDLPNKEQLEQFEKEERLNRPISESLKSIIKNYPKNSHPMDTTRTSVSHMGLEDPDTADNSKDANMRKAMRLLARISTAVAADFRVRKGENIIDPDPKKHNKGLVDLVNLQCYCGGMQPPTFICNATIQYWDAKNQTDILNTTRTFSYTLSLLSSSFL